MGILRSSALAWLATVAALGATLALAGCSDDEPADPPSPGEQTTSEQTTSEPTSDEPTASGSAPDEPTVTGPDVEPSSPEAAVVAFYDAFAAGDHAAACGWWTTDYTTLSIDRWNDGDYGPEVDSCRGLLRELTEVFAIVGDPAELLLVVEVSSEQPEDTRALVDVTLAAAEDETETYELTLTDDGWRISGDEAGELAATEQPSTTSPTAPPPSASPSPEG